MPDQDLHGQAVECRQGKALAQMWLGTAIAAIAAVLFVYFLRWFGGR